MRLMIMNDDEMKMRTVLNRELRSLYKIGYMNVLPVKNSKYSLSICVLLRIFFRFICFALHLSQSI